MDDPIEVRRRSYPDVCRWFAAFVLLLPLMLAAMLGAPPWFQLMTRGLSIVALVWMAVETAFIARRGSGPVPRVALVAGLALVIGGPCLVAVGIVTSNPILTRIVSPEIRYLLGAGWPRPLVVYLTAAAPLLALTVWACLMWVAFLRQREAFAALVWLSQPRSWGDFVKAALGGGHLTWRQLLTSFRPRHSPYALYPGFMFATVFMPAGSLYVWTAGLRWLGFHGLTRQASLQVFALGLIASLIWLHWEWKRGPRPGGAETQAKPPVSGDRDR